MYIIDARAVLHPPSSEEEVEIDWSGLSFAESTQEAEMEKMEDIHPKLGEIEVDIASPSILSIIATC